MVIKNHEVVFSFVCFLFFETGFLYQADLKLPEFCLPLPPKCWDYSAPPLPGWNSYSSTEETLNKGLLLRAAREDDENVSQNGRGV